MNKTMMLLLALASFSGASQEFPQDYKCYLLDSNDVPRIYFFEFVPSKRLTAISRLPGTLKKDAYGNPESVIKEVIECVAVKEDFSSRDARFLDEQTPK